MKHALPARTDFVVSDQASDGEVSIVLLQDGVTRTDLAARRVYALSDHVTAMTPLAKQLVTSPTPVGNGV